jgi:protocatechuate 3,4-dioxygenase beta subunit
MITAHAQFRAGVQGTVSDSNGALVPTAKVIIKDMETGKTQEATTSDEGFYRISGLAPGRYELSVEKEGYKKSVAESVTVGAENIQASMSFWRSARSPQWSRSPMKQSRSSKLRMQT